MKELAIGILGAIFGLAFGVVLSQSVIEKNCENLKTFIMNNKQYICIRAEKNEN